MKENDKYKICCNLLIEIKKLIKKYPNDADLGEIVRKLYNK